MWFVMGPTMPMSVALFRVSNMPESQSFVTTVSLFRSRTYSPEPRRDSLIAALREAEIRFGSQ